MRKSHWQTALRLLIGPILLGWLVYTIGLDKVWQTIQSANGTWFFVAVGCYSLTILLRTLRWQTFLNAQGIVAPVRQLLPLDLVGGFFNLVLPSSVGGDVVKFYQLHQQHPDSSQPLIASTLIADRLAGIIVLLWMGALVTPLALGGGALTLTTLGLTLAGTAGLGLLLSERGRGWLEKVPGMGWLLKNKAIRTLYESLSGYRLPVLVRAFGIAFLFNLVMIGCYGALGVAFGLPISWHVYFVIVPLLSLAQAIPLTPNGLGLREGGAVALLALFGVSETGALALALGYLACLVLAGLVGGVLTLVYSLHPLLTASRTETPSDGGSSAV